MAGYFYSPIKNQKPKCAFLLSDSLDITQYSVYRQQNGKHRISILFSIETF